MLYLIYKELKLVSLPEGLSGSDLMNHVPSDQPHLLHREEDVLHKGTAACQPKTDSADAPLHLSNNLDPSVNQTWNIHILYILCQSLRQSKKMLK